MNLELKDVIPYIGAALAAPVALVWRRATGAVQRAELAAAVDRMEATMKTHAEEDSRRFGGIFSRIDEVASSTARIEGYIQAQRDQHGR